MNRTILWTRRIEKNYIADTLSRQEKRQTAQITSAELFNDEIKQMKKNSNTLLEKTGIFQYLHVALGHQGINRCPRQSHDPMK